MTKHTPGPWVVRGGGAWVVQGGHIIATPDGTLIGLATQQDLPDWGTVFANARLMAAAPSLLAELKSSLALAQLLRALHAATPMRLRAAEESHVIDWDKVIADTSAAIAKAEGGAS